MEGVVNNGQVRSRVYSGVSAGMHRALTTRTGLPEVGMQVELCAAVSAGLGTSGGAGVITEGPKCWSLTHSINKIGQLAR